MQDVIVVGGGMVGASIALALGRAGLQVALVERQSPTPQALDAEFDLRISAINRRSEAWLNTLDAWSALPAARLQPYHTLRCFEGNLAPLDFTAAELQQSHLGTMIENVTLQQCLWQQLPANVHRYSPATLQQLEQQSEHVQLTLTDGTVLTAPLLVAADGAQSKIRTWAGIGQSGQQYEQACLLLHVALAEPIPAMTWQQFTEQGPRALLPLPNQQASLVWYDQHRKIAELAALAKEALAVEVRKHFPQALGSFRILNAGYFPLTRSHAHRYHQQRVVLVGDAAHTINPLAGQGVNLGFADAKALTELVIEAYQRGGDWGTSTVLAQYEQKRRLANQSMMSAMDVFYHCFSSDLTPIRQLRKLGLQLASNAGPLKRWVGQYAAGL